MSTQAETTSRFLLHMLQRGIETVRVKQPKSGYAAVKITFGTGTDTDITVCRAEDGTILVEAHPSNCWDETWTPPAVATHTQGNLVDLTLTPTKKEQTV